MSIKIKTLVIIGISSLMLIAVLQIFSKFTFENQLSGYENYTLNNTLLRSEGILFNEIETFGNIAGDWANRSGIYDFSKNPKDEFISKNLRDDILLGQRINLIVVINNQGKLVWNKIFNFDHEKVFEDQELIDLLVSSEFLTDHKNAQMTNGIINVKGRAMMIASRSIRSYSESEKRGTLILGRYLTDTEISRITNLLQLKVTYHDYNDEQILSELNYKHFGAKTTFSQPITENLIAGYIVVKDIYGSPAFILRVESKRGIFERGKVFINYFIFALAVVVLLITLLLISLMIKFVSGRIGSLSSSVLKIGETKDVTQRVEESGRDEIEYLAKEINKMLYQIEQSFEKRKMYERELIAARDKAEASDKLKSEFLAQMSHEIRTPLNVILSHISLLHLEDDKSLSDEFHNTISMIEKGGQRLIRTMDLIMNVSMVQSGTYENNKDEVFLYNELLLPVFEEYRLTAESKGLKVMIDNKFESDKKINADWYALSQVFHNLLDNAVKYTEKGTILCEIGLNRDKVYVEISDTGIGMSEEYQQKMYMPFTQEDEGYTRKYEGNGLGLTLVKKYCDLNNIDIKVTSQKNLGTKFVLIFN